MNAAVQPLKSGTLVDVRHSQTLTPMDAQTNSDRRTSIAGRMISWNGSLEVSCIVFRVIFLSCFYSPLHPSADLASMTDTIGKFSLAPKPDFSRQEEGALPRWLGNDTAQ